MNEVKRYDAGCNYAGEDEMVERTDGSYVKYEDYAELKAQRDALAASFDELAASIGWSKEQCEQTGESPMDVAASLVNLVSELEGEDSKTAGHLEKLAGSMLNRSLDSGREQAVAYAQCAYMVAKFARQLRAGEPA